jgi:hypothetical protein
MKKFIFFSIFLSIAGFSFLHAGKSRRKSGPELQASMNARNQLPKNNAANQQSPSRSHPSKGASIQFNHSSPRR